MVTLTAWQVKIETSSVFNIRRSTLSVRCSKFILFLLSSNLEHPTLNFEYGNAFSVACSVKTSSVFHIQRSTLSVQRSEFIFSSLNPEPHTPNPFHLHFSQRLQNTFFPVPHQESNHFHLEQSRIFVSEVGRLFFWRKRILPTCPQSGDVILLAVSKRILKDGWAMSHK